MPGVNQLLEVGDIVPEEGALQLTTLLFYGGFEFLEQKECLPTNSTVRVSCPQGFLSPGVERRVHRAEEELGSCPTLYMIARAEKQAEPESGESLAATAGQSSRR